MQQPPIPVIVNVLSSAPDWRITAMVALATALIAAGVAAYIARSRDHEKWVFERRVDAYIKLRILIQEYLKSPGYAALLDIEEADPRLPQTRSFSQHIEDSPACHEIYIFASRGISEGVKKWDRSIEELSFAAAQWQNRLNSPPDNERVGEDNSMEEVARANYVAATLVERGTLMLLTASLASEIRQPPKIFSFTEAVRRRKISRSVSVASRERDRFFELYGVDR